MSNLVELVVDLRSHPTESGVERAIGLIAKERSLSVLGDVLRLDQGLEIPVEVVVSTYRRLLELGAADVRVVVCFARYLLLHGPEWDDEANAMLAQVEPVARAAGVWDGRHLGHHPVFFADCA